MAHPFSNVTEQEKNKKETAKKTIEEALRSTTDIARRILTSEDGKKYREKIEDDLKTITEMLLRVCADDPEKDAFFSRACLNKMAVLYALLKDIQKDAE